MSKFKAGDLALVINHTFPPVIGTCVELISRHLVGPVDRSNPMDPGVYETPDGEPVWVVDDQGAIVWEKWLMPPARGLQTRAEEGEGGGGMSTSVKGFRRWLRTGRNGRARQLRMRDRGLAWFPPAREKRWVPGAPEQQKAKEVEV